MTRFAEELMRRYPAPPYAVVENLLRQVEAARISSSRAEDLSMVAKVPFKSRDLLQVGLRRTLELATGFIEAFNAELFVPLFVLGRASVETGCLLWDFWRRIEHILANRDKGGVADFNRRVMDALFGAKSTVWTGGPPEFTAPNVLTILDRLAKEHPKLRESYDALSEFSHPNCAGMHAVYCQSDAKHRESVYVDRPFEFKPQALSIAVKALGIGLSTAHFAVDQHEQRLVEWTQLCEEAIHDAGGWPAGVPYPAR